MDKFPSRYLGSRRPLRVPVKNADGTPKDLTDDTATFTITDASGVVTVAAEAHTNTPGAEAVFEYTVGAGAFPTAQTYTVLVDMVIDGIEDPHPYALQVKPLT